MRTSVYVFDCPDLTRGQPSSGTERVDVGAREDSRTGQGVANDVVPNLVVVQDVAFREHGVPERVDVGLGDIVVEANSIAVDVAEEYCTAPDLLHGDLDRIHEQVAGRDPVEVIGESLSFDSGFPAAGRASVPVREGRRATVVKMNDALGGDCRDVDCAPAVVDFTRAVVEGKCSAGEDRRIMPHVAIGGGIPLVHAHRRRRHRTVVTAGAERYETSVSLRRQIYFESDAGLAFARVPRRHETL